MCKLQVVVVARQAERSALDEQGGRYKGDHLHIIRSDQVAQRWNFNLIYYVVYIFVIWRMF